MQHLNAVHYASDMEQDFATTWAAYVRRQLDAHRDGLTNEQIGDLIGASGSMIGNWIKAEGFKQPSVDKVVSFWRRFGQGSTLPEAQAAAGFAGIEEFDTVVRHEPDLDMVDIDSLLDAVRRRTEPGFSPPSIPGGVITKPVSLREARVARAKQHPL